MASFKIMGATFSLVVLVAFLLTSVEGKRRLLRPQRDVSSLEEPFLADTLNPHFVQTGNQNLFTSSIEKNPAPKTIEDESSSSSPVNYGNYYKAPKTPKKAAVETLEEQDARIQAFIEEQGRATCSDRYMEVDNDKSAGKDNKMSKSLKVPRVQVKNVPKGAKPFSLSSISYGTLHSGSDIPNGQAMLEIVKTALNLGITTFDMADVYGWYTDGHGKSNDLMGEALKLDPSIRDEIEFVCKFGIRLNGGYHVDTSPSWIRSMVDTYLTTFNTDYIDVLMIHNPPSYLNAWDIAATYKDLYDEGKVKYFGVSNFFPNDFDRLEEAMQAHDLTLSVLETMFSTSRPQKWNDGTVPNMLNKETPIPVLAWGAVGGDPMNGPNPLFVNPGWKEQQFVNHLTEFGGSNMNGLAADQVMMTWLTSMQNVVAILGTTKADRLVFQTMPTICGEEMSDEEWQSLLQYSSNLGIPPPF